MTWYGQAVTGFRILILVAYEHIRKIKLKCLFLEEKCLCGEEMKSVYNMKIQIASIQKDLKCLFLEEKCLIFFR